jgi:hypothetical protein
MPTVSAAPAAGTVAFAATASLARWGTVCAAAAGLTATGFAGVAPDAVRFAGTGRNPAIFVASGFGAVGAACRCDEALSLKMVLQCLQRTETCLPEMRSSKVLSEMDSSRKQTWHV